MTAEYEEFDYGDEEWELEEDEAETEILPPEEHGKLRVLQETAVEHPRIALGGSTLLLSFVVDVAVHDPFITILGLAAAAVIGWKGEDLMQIIVPGSDQEAAREDADRFADNLLEGYPVYSDQSANAKFKRLFHLPSADWTEVGEEDKIVDALPPKRKQIAPPQKRVSQTNSSGGLTVDRITEWFESGRIDDTQFFELLERIDNATQNATRSARSVDPKAASEDAVSPQNMDDTRVALPPGWTKEKMTLIPGFYRVFNNLDDALKAIEVSTHPRNRDFGREILKQQGLWKEK